MQFIESSVVGVRSAVITLACRSGPLRFVLFPMIHVGERSFYAQVTARLRECAIIVAEGDRLTTLINDIYQRGLDKKVLLVVTGEFGRTPRLENRDGRIGRDHYPGAMSILISGGGMPMGMRGGGMGMGALPSGSISVAPMGSGSYGAMGLGPGSRGAPTVQTSQGGCLAFDGFFDHEALVLLPAHQHGRAARHRAHASLRVDLRHLDRGLAAVALAPFANHDRRCQRGQDGDQDHHEHQLDQGEAPSERAAPGSTYGRFQKHEKPERTARLVPTAQLYR